MILALQRNLIKVELKKKLDTWRSPSYASKYFSNIPVKQELHTFVVEKDATGYYYISSPYVNYSNILNGQTFRMKSIWKEKDWDCYCELYNLGIESSKFKIDVPKYREIITYGQENWEYTELQSPGLEYGTNFNDDIVTFPKLTNGETASSQIKDYFILYIEQAYEISKQAKIIATKNRVGMPVDINLIINRYQDKNGFFWSDFDKQLWVNSLEYFISDSIYKFECVLEYAHKFGVLDVTTMIELLGYARTKWQTI